MCNMGEERLEKLVWGVKSRFKGRRRSWDSVTCKCIEEYGLEEEAKMMEANELELGEWEKAVETQVNKGIIKKWREDIGKKSKLWRYDRVKEGRWGMEKWMLGRWTKDKKIKFRWRSGSCGLMEDLGRREGGSKQCVACRVGEETVEHVMWGCSGYERVRQEFCVVMEIEAQKVGEEGWWREFLESSEGEKTRLILGGKVKSGSGGVKSAFKVSLMLESIGIQLIRKIHEHRIQLVYGCCPTSLNYANECGGSQSTYSTKPMVSCHN